MVSEGQEQGAIDIQEATVQSKDGYSDFRMDNVISSMDIAFNYEFVPVFYGNYKYGLDGRSFDWCEITKQAKYSYFE